jgi:hypothetical protein
LKKSLSVRAENGTVAIIGEQRDFYSVIFIESSLQLDGSAAGDHRWLSPGNRRQRGDDAAN